MFATSVVHGHSFEMQFLKLASMEAIFVFLIPFIIHNVPGAQPLVGLVARCNSPRIERPGGWPSALCLILLILYLFTFSLYKSLPRVIRA